MCYIKILILLLALGSAESQLKLLNNVIAMEVGATEEFQLDVGIPNNGTNKIVTLTCVDDDILQVTPDSFAVNFNDTDKIHTIELKSLKAGKSGIIIIATTLLSTNIIEEMEHLIVEIYESEIILELSNIMGWGYFFAWSISFYPQIYKNFKRKSVKGLSVDFNWFNLFGYAVYNMFNIGIYYSSTVQDEFSTKNPHSVNPVHLNDIVFSVHSFVVTFIILAQCYYYERQTEKASNIASVLLTGLFLVPYGLTLMALGDFMSWLNMLYICSYLKLAVCFIRAIPQIILNSKSPLTRGCSIGTIVLDFVGGVMCIAQMVLDTVNYDDWNCIVGNPSKLGIAVFSIVFDVIFAMQHYFVWDHGLHLRKNYLASNPTPALSECDNTAGFTNNGSEEGEQNENRTDTSTNTTEDNKNAENGMDLEDTKDNFQENAMGSSKDELFEIIEDTGKCEEKCETEEAESYMSAISSILAQVARIFDKRENN